MSYFHRLVVTERGGIPGRAQVQARLPHRFEARGPLTEAVATSEVGGRADQSQEPVGASRDGSAEATATVTETGPPSVEHGPASTEAGPASTEHGPASVEHGPTPPAGRRPPAGDGGPRPTDRVEPRGGLAGDIATGSDRSAGSDHVDLDPLGGHQATPWGQQPVSARSIDADSDPGARPVAGIEGHDVGRDRSSTRPSEGGTARFIPGRPAAGPPLQPSPPTATGPGSVDGRERVQRDGTGSATPTAALSGVASTGLPAPAGATAPTGPVGPLARGLLTPLPAASPPLHPAADPADQGPSGEITIRIDQVEVVAEVARPSTTAPVRRAEPRRVLSLDQYLDQQGR